MKKFDELPDNLKGIVALMFASLAFAVMAALIKLAGVRLHVTQILLIRQIGMLLILGPQLVGHFWQALSTTRLDLQCVRIFFALIAMLFGFTALIHMPLADATALGFAKSFFITIFAVLVLRETVGFYRWSAVAVGFGGVLVMLQPTSEGFDVYGLMAVIGAASAGLVMVIIRLLSRTESASTILLYQSLGVGIIMIGPALIYWKTPTFTEWMLLIGIGVVSYFGQKGNIYAFKWGEASLLASLDYTRLLYATLLGYFLFDQLPDMATWIGAFIIILASIYTIRREAVRNQKLARSADGRFHANH